MSLEIRTPGEAFYLAAEMEKRAIRLYERALLIFSQGPCRAAITEILCQERQHLSRFEEMGAQAPDFEQAQLLAAQAARTLFPGGLMQAQRQGAFASPQALLAYAAEEEQGPIQRYSGFAAQFQGPAGEAFSAIAKEEESHYHQLGALLAGGA